MKRLFFTFICVFCLSLVGKAQSETVTLKGMAKDYAGFNLVIEKTDNYISRESRQLGNIKVSDTGYFELTISLSETTFAFIQLGMLEGTIYLEPGMSYELILPPYSPKQEADVFNPYFVPEKVVLGIINDEALTLNRLIIQFGEDYSHLYNTHAFELFNNEDVALANQIKAELDSLYPNTQMAFFNAYKHFSYAGLDLLSQKRQKRSVIEHYFSDQAVQTQNPAYWDSFNQLFQNFFTYYLTGTHGKALKAAFASDAPFDTLSMALGEDTLFRGPEFREVVLLKGLYDAFYSGRYNEDKLITLMAQAEEMGQTTTIRRMARAMHKKVNHLRVGTEAPPFSVYTLSAKEKELSDYKGKFVYLNFCNTENYTCKKDFQVLDAIHNNMKRDVSVVSIATDKDPDALEAFVKKNKYKWDILHLGASANVLFDYNIKALPSYFLIDPEGNILLAPAPGPEENFGAVFNEALKNFRYKELKKENPQQKSIYDL